MNLFKNEIVFKIEEEYIEVISCNVKISSIESIELKRDNFYFNYKNLNREKTKISDELKEAIKNTKLPLVFSVASISETLEEYEKRKRIPIKVEL